MKLWICGIFIFILNDTGLGNYCCDGSIKIGAHLSIDLIALYFLSSYIRHAS